jgi:hypothetical protein
MLSHLRKRFQLPNLIWKNLPEDLAPSAFKGLAASASLLSLSRKDVLLKDPLLLKSWACLNTEDLSSCHVCWLL